MSADLLRRAAEKLRATVEGTSAAPCESDPAALRAELVQSAAVHVAWIEAIDRREPEGGAAP